MEEKIRLLKEIDAAIDAMDEAGINKGLEALRNLEESPVYVEDSKSYAAHILKQSRRENKMIRPKRYVRAAIAAAAIALMGVTAYAATTLNLFGFGNGDTYVTVRTNQQISEQEARALVESDGRNPAEQPEDAGMQVDTEETAYDSVEAAARALDMEIPLPAAMPQMQLESVKATVNKFGDAAESRTVWIEYEDGQGRMLGITVVREIMSDDVSSFTTNDMDPGSLGTYQSKSGVVYTTLTESDDSGANTAHIATAMIGEYEYSFVFMGFEEAQRQEVIDSVDLSGYGKH